jgi:hypothetical protein
MALRTPSLAGGSPLTPRYGLFDEPAAADALAFVGGAHGALFVATERAAMADAQLQRDARVESLQRRWAEARRSATRAASNAAPLTPLRAAACAGRQRLQRLAAGHAAAGLRAVARPRRLHAPGRALIRAAVAPAPPC